LALAIGSPSRFCLEFTTDPAQARANKRLAEQIRKILGKHYASKYRVR